MEKRNSPEHLSIGKAAQLEEQKETLPAVEVKNKVRWVNNEIQFPLNLEVGKQTKIGLFLTTKEGEKSQHLEVMTKHGRTGILGRALFSDQQGTVFREIELKGSGHVLTDELYPDKRSSLSVGPVKRNKQSVADRTEGVLDLNDAEHDKEISELFYHNGIRVPRVIALIDLEEVVDENGVAISVSEAKRKGMIFPKTDVGIEVRAFATKARVSESEADNWDVLLEDARTLVAQELGIVMEQFTVRDYVQWFAKTLSTEVGKMHKLGYFHGYLTRHNITLDCRIVDFDSVKRFSDIQEDERPEMEFKINRTMGEIPHLKDIKKLAIVHDYIMAYTTLEKLVEAAGLKKGRDNKMLKAMSENFEKSYVEASGSELPEI